MKAWAVVPLLAMSGCLYLDRLNHVPTVAWSRQQLTSTNIGGALLLSATPKDDEDDSSELAVSYVVASADDQPLQDCDYLLSSTKAYGGAPVSVQFFRQGTFSVTATTSDSRGAVSDPASVMVTVTDAAPTFGGAMIAPTTGGNFCGGKFTAGDRISFGLSGGTPRDPDMRSDGQGCGVPAPLTFTWRVVAPAGAQALLTPYVGGGCSDPTPSSGAALTVSDPMQQVCLITDGTLMSGLAMYTLVVEAFDGSTTVPSNMFQLAVGPNEMPCITGTTPTAGSYVIDRTQPFTLAVDNVVDDRDRFTGDGGPITFGWSVSSDSQPTWVKLADYTLSRYDLDASAFPVGDVVHVRVEAFDSSKTPASAAMCPLTASDCDVDSCAAKPCHKWRTWDLELR